MEGGGAEYLLAGPGRERSPARRGALRPIDAGELPDQGPDHGRHGDGQGAGRYHGPEPHSRRQRREPPQRHAGAGCRQRGRLRRYRLGRLPGRPLRDQAHGSVD